MKATFLGADVSLTKTFFLKDGKVEKIGHPQILNYTSYDQPFNTIEDLLAHLKVHASEGHCFLKGHVTRPLNKEPRKGTTNPNEETRILLLDIDGIKGEADVESVLAQCKLNGADYIIQWSSSAGVIPERGMSCHVFIILDKPYAPAILKQYLIQFNLTVPLLQQNVGLTRTYNALRWPLDITTCQNDKLIYIAPPLLRDGVVDNFSGERISLVKGKSRTLALPEPFPNAENNATKQQEKLNELRKTMGLKERPKTTMRTEGPIEYMSKPDRAVVTGIKENNKFVYLNLNGGDSWAYYYPADNPKFIYNFKNEPVYKTSELLPDYWQEVKDKMNEVRVDSDGRMYLAFRDFASAVYYNGTFEPKTSRLIIAPAKSESQLRSFMLQHGQPWGDFVPDWTVRFDPNSDYVVDTDNKIVNTFQPTSYMKMKPRVVKEVPKTIRRVIHHMLGEDEEITEHWLNWTAVIWQYRTRTETAWVTHGVPGTGKGLVFKNVLTPLFGADNVVPKRIRELDAPYNAFLEKAMIVWVDEAEQNDLNMKGPMSADLKNYITEPRISIRAMYSNPRVATNFCNFIFPGNGGHIVRIDPEDRRYNVGKYQPNRLMISEEEIKLMEDELVEFAHYLSTRTADRQLARTALNNQAKQTMIGLNMASIDVASQAIRDGNLDYFWSMMPQDGVENLPRFEQEKARRYVQIMTDIVKHEYKCILREELHAILEYTIGNIPEAPMKFASMMKHHKLDIVHVSRNGRTFRGVPVRWKINPEWKGHANEDRGETKSH